MASQEDTKRAHRGWSVYEEVGYAILSYDLGVGGMDHARSQVAEGTHRWVLGAGATLRCLPLATPLGDWEHELQDRDGHFHAC